jgi:hypothetical protein
MKKLFTRAEGYHYFYKGHIICIESERPGERKYSYRKIGDGYDKAGHARTLNLAQIWINCEVEK